MPNLVHGQSAVDGRGGQAGSSTRVEQPAYTRSYRPWGESRTRRVPAGPQRSWQQLGKGPTPTPRFRHDESIEQALRNRNKPQQDPRFRPLSAEEFAAMNGMHAQQQDLRFRPLNPPPSSKSLSNPAASRQDTKGRGFGMPGIRDYSSLPYANQGWGQGWGQGTETRSTNNTLSVNPLPGSLGSGLYGAGLFPAPATPVSPWSYPGPWPIPGFY